MADQKDHGWLVLQRKRGEALVIKSKNREVPPLFMGEIRIVIEQRKKETWKVAIQCPDSLRVLRQEVEEAKEKKAQSKVGKRD